MSKHIQYLLKNKYMFDISSTIYILNTNTNFVVYLFVLDCNNLIIKKMSVEKRVAIEIILIYQDK